MSWTPIARLNKNLIERAYREGAQLGLAVWTQDEAGPYPTRPMPGQSWAEQGQAQRQPHEYVRNGKAKLLTLFCPSSGELRAKGVSAAPKVVLHPWLQQELTGLLDRLPAAPPVTDAVDAADNHAAWEQWQHGLKMPITLPALLPPLRLLLVWDNLKGHLTPTMVLWLFSHGVMPLYTPLSGSWLKMAESIQRMRSINRVPCALGAGVIGTAKVCWRTAAQRLGNARRQGSSAS